MNTPELSNPSRRQVLCGLVATLVAGGAVTTACGSSSGGTAGTQPGGTTAGTTGGATSVAGGAVAKLADVPVGGGVVVDSPDGSGKILLVQPASGQVKAFNAICPHAGVTVAAPKGATVTCPGHGSQFDTATGALKKGPATTGLTPIQVKVTGTEILLS